MNKPKEMKEDGKEMKKKIKWVIVIITVLFAGLISACGNTEQPESTPAIKEETAEEENLAEETAGIKGAEVAENNQQEETTDSDNLDAAPENTDYLHLGGTYINGDGVSAEVIDIDYNIDGNDIGNNVYTSVGIFVAMEITNNSGNDIYFDQNDAVLFIDDYEITKESTVTLFQQNGYCIVNNTKKYPTVANIRSGGRKGTIVFVTYLTSGHNITETSDIDFEISGLTFKINPRFILEQFAEKVEELTPEEAPARTELNGKTIIAAKDGAYTSSNSDVTITVEDDILTAHRSDKFDIDDRFILYDEEVPNYFMTTGRGLTITFFDGGLFIEADPEDDMLNDLDGLYSISGDNSADTGNVEVNNTSSDGIGNPVIDANPDRYIPEGITGELDVIDGTFYSNKPIIDHVAVNNIVPGEYLIVGGGNAVLTITNDYKASLKYVSDEVDFEDADMKEMVITDSALSYQVYENDTGFVISFYEGGVYLYTDYPDDENDWAEGFYELLN